MSRLSDLIRLDNHAVAIYREPSIPEDAVVPNEHCTLPSLFVRCIRTGEKCASDSEHSPCIVSKSGFGFGGIPNRQRAAWSTSEIPEEEIASMGRHGPGMACFKTPDIAMLQIEMVKDYGDGTDAIVFQDLDEALAENRPIEVVAFLVDPARLTALQQLAAYSKATPGPAAIMPFGFACQQVYALPRAEGEKDDPHAILGMTDMYARRFVGRDELSFAVPFKLYKRMIEDLDTSFLTKDYYQNNLRRCIGPNME